LDHLNDVLLQAKERAQLLTEIGTLGETARSKQRDCRVNQGFVLYASQQAAEGAEEQILSAICDGNREIDRLQEELQYQKERTEQAHQRWMDALRENQNSPERQQLQVFEDLVKDREKDYTEARKALSSLQNAKQELEALNRKLSDCRRALPAEQMPDAIEQLPEQRQTEQLTAMEQLLREREDSLDQEEFQVRSDLQQLKERQKALQAKIETLEKGQLVYPDQDRAKRVCQAINRELAQQGMEADARILCEILTVQEPDWQACIEACLGNRRFDIFVSPPALPYRQTGI